MAESHCRTCGEPLTTCHCPPPDPPDTLGRVVTLHAARQALLQWAIGVPGQHDPMVRAQVDAEIQRIREADEATIHHMARTAGLLSYRQRSPKLDPAEFFARHYAYRESFLAKHGRWPTLTEEACDMGFDRKTIWNYLHPGRRAQKKRPHA